MEVIVPFGEAETPRTARGKCSRILSYWSLVIMIISLQVFAASCLSFYFLGKQLQNATEHLEKEFRKELMTKCITHWTVSPKSRQGPGEGEKTLAWETTSGQIINGNCTAYNESEQSMEIKNAGFYFIYVQVKFKSHSQTVKFIMDFGGKEKVQNSRRPAVRGAVYFGSTYKLPPGTKIFVKANPQTILFHETETFFGLFEL
ncbi:CD40 ligand-like isoform X1 [Heterodontus francisci]|uniref:CD40 ligand-like isoform X1 n=1 Tax=Heterodontus francisci TaxID=7792 RepID=UPI00355B3573